MNSGPGEIFRSDPAIGRESSCLHHHVQSRSKQLEGIESGVARFGGVEITFNLVGNGECSSKEPGLGQSKFQVTRPDRAKDPLCQFYWVLGRS